MRKSAKTRFLAVITAMSMIMTLTPTTAFAAEGGAASGIQLQKPKNENGVVTWDCVYFGNYPQSDTTGATKDPIKWRVLDVTDTDGDGIADDAFLLADRNLDVRPYNDTLTDVTWATCSLRKWLNNGDFMSTAFTPAEQTAIKDTTVVNDGASGGALGGDNTTDKVYLLSIDEVQNPAYGFTADYSVTKTREARNTAYVESKPGVNSVGETNWSWWLRSPGGNADYAAFVSSYGRVFEGGYYVYESSYAARPALHLNPQSSCWSYAGTVSSDGTEKAGITEVSLPAASFSYTEQPITPEPIVKSVGKLLVKGTDYTVSYMNNTNVGTATVTVTGKGAYIGTISKTFSITNTVKSTSIKKLTKTKKSFTVKWKKSTASNATGYQVRYSTKASMAGAKTKTIKGWKNTSKKITKLKAKKKYYVQVRAYKTVSGTNYYSDWSATKSVKTK